MSAKGPDPLCPRVVLLSLMTKAVVLAAGRGSRLKSPEPKVLHKIFDKPVLAWVLDTLAEVEVEEIIVVCGYKAEDVENFLHAYPVTTVRQEEQLGTGHALKIAAEAIGDYEGSVLVLNGDSPLIEAQTINDLLRSHQENVHDLSFLSCDLERPYGYGRVIRKGSDIMAIKEEKDCSEPEKSITEINAGVYVFEWQTTQAGLDTLSNNNAQEEYYLTDLVSWSYTQGLACGTHTITNPYEVMGINTREDLALVWKLKNEANIEQLMRNGVTVVDPASTMISPDVDIGQDTVIYPGTYIQRRVVIGTGCQIGPNTTIFGPAEIGANSTVLQSHILRSSIAENVTVGPFAHIRSGADIANDCKVGSFVEVKNSSFGEKTMASHLSYIGDAKLKNNVNIGAGTVVANYDHRTGKKESCTIHSNASTGANSVLISPVEIGSDATIGAGSVITKDVPAGNLAVARARQENLSKTVKS